MQIIFLLILIYSIILHEIAHGYVADKLGDPTARYAGRLTLNPIPHIDLLGSIILPLISVFSPGSFLFGWAKPVPYNPYNLVRAPKWGEALIAGAGPATNFLLAAFFTIFSKVSHDQTLIAIGLTGVAANIWLGVLNLIPIPPLDGSKVLEALLPRSLAMSYSKWRANMERSPFLGMGLLLLIVIFFGGVLNGLLNTVVQAIAGM